MYSYKLIVVLLSLGDKTRFKEVNIMNYFAIEPMQYNLHIIVNIFFSWVSKQHILREEMKKTKTVYAK